MEAQEVVEFRQITNITIFALFFLVASYQASIANFYLLIGKRAIAIRCHEASNLMFLASLMAILDASLDFAIQFASNNTLATKSLPLLFILDWGINLIAVILAIQSIEKSLPIVLFKHPADDGE